MKIRIKDISDILTSFSPSLAALFFGPPGIGKTETIVKTAAEQALAKNKIMIDLSGDTSILPTKPTTIITPTGTRDLIKTYEKLSVNPDKYYVYLRIVASQITIDDLQYPRIVSDSIVNMPPIKLSMLTMPNIEGLLFIDEITNVKDDSVKSMLFAIINEKTLGLSGQLSPMIKIVAAGNTDEDSSIAEPLPAPLINRFAVFYVEPPTSDEFIEHYESTCNNCSPLVTAYLSINKEHVYVKPDEPETFNNFPTPRTWYRLGKILPTMPKHLIHQTAVALLGPKIGSEFYAFTKLNPPTPEELIKDPSKFDNLNFETKILASIQLSRYVANLEITDKIIKTYKHIYETNAEILIIALRILAHKDINKAFNIAEEIGIHNLAEIKITMKDIESQLNQ